MNIIIMGPPGSGKGVQAKLLSKKLNIPILSTGNAFRDQMKKETKLGVEAGKYVSRGDLPPRDMVEDVIVEYLKDLDISKGVIFEGCPRTVEQLEHFDQLLERCGLDRVDLVLVLKVSQKVATERYVGRIKEVVRTDNDREVIKHRFDVYREETEPVVEGFKKKDVKVVEIDGERSIEEIHQDILKKLGLS